MAKYWGLASIFSLMAVGLLISACGDSEEITSTPTLAATPTPGLPTTHT